MPGLGAGSVTFNPERQHETPEPPAVGYGCAAGCGGIAYFPSSPGDLCTGCKVTDVTHAAPAGVGA